MRTKTQNELSRSHTDNNSTTKGASQSCSNSPTKGRCSFAFHTKGCVKACLTRNWWLRGWKDWLYLLSRHGWICLGHGKLSGELEPSTSSWRPSCVHVSWMQLQKVPAARCLSMSYSKSTIWSNSGSASVPVWQQVQPWSCVAVAVVVVVVVVDLVLKCSRVVANWALLLCGCTSISRHPSSSSESQYADSGGDGGGVVVFSPGEFAEGRSYLVVYSSWRCCRYRWTMSAW